MSASAEGVRGGRRVREGVSPPLVGGGGGMGASPRKSLKFRMQESASETIFYEKKNSENFAVKRTF